MRSPVAVESKDLDIGSVFQYIGKTREPVGGLAADTGDSQMFEVMEDDVFGVGGIRERTVKPTDADDEHREVGHPAHPSFHRSAVVDVLEVGQPGERPFSASEVPEETAMANERNEFGC